MPKGTPRWGAAWKAAAAKYYNSSFGWGAQGSVQAYRGNYLDLDPTYTNEHGQPLMRMTFDWGKHERKYSDWLITKYEPMAKAHTMAPFAQFAESNFVPGFRIPMSFGVHLCDAIHHVTEAGDEREEAG